EHKWKAMVDGLSKSLYPVRAEVPVGPAAQLNIGSDQGWPEISLDYLRSILLAQFAQDASLRGILVERLEDRLVIALPGKLAFESGKADLSSTGRAALYVLGGALGNIGNGIAVHGHTDPRPPRGSVFPSNWELSLMRAAAVARGLRDVGYDRRVRTLGHAEGRFAELSSALAPERRMVLARRVDIIVHEGIGGTP
ncbi:MAG: OmpA/MotB family protein, partial [Alphaproteobacteria bacterium]